MKILELLKSEKCKNLKEKSSQPVIFHVFSNGGANIYSKLIKEIYQYNSVFNYQPIHVAGVVFDSCPGRPRPFTGMKAALVSNGDSRTSDSTRFTSKWPKTVVTEIGSGDLIWIQTSKWPKYFSLWFWAILRFELLMALNLKMALNVKITPNFKMVHSGSKFEAILKFKPQNGPKRKVNIFGPF